jgi:hypothetical protein
MFTMEDVANMLLEVEDIKESNSYYGPRGPLGVDFIQSHIALEMLAYKTYRDICKQEGLFISNLVRYEHCQLDLAILRHWYEAQCEIDVVELNADWLAEPYEDGYWQAEEQLLRKLHDDNGNGDVQ